jgi:hypothetical protein
MARRLLLITLLALTFSGSALAAGSVTCSVSSTRGGCFIEQPVWVLGPLEVAVGVDAQAGWGAGAGSHLAPYAVVGWFSPAAWAIWVEFALPSSRVPVLGRPDAWRVGFTFRFP